MKLNLRPTHWLSPALAALLLGLPPASIASSTGLVISQVYGGGGSTNTSASYKLDWVELFNAGTSPVSLTGLSLQYGSSTGSLGASSNQVAALADFTLAPGQYYLVAMAPGSGTLGGADLPAEPDSGGYAIAMGNTNGKIALVTGSSQLLCGSSSSPCTATQSARLIDLVGYGSADLYEGSGPAAALSISKAALRQAGGCTDTDVNGADFTAVSNPVPRTSASPFNVCGSSDQPIVPVCPASLAVSTGSAGSAVLTARDADGIVNSAVFAVAPATGITMSGFSAAVANDGTASVTLNIATSVLTGSYPVQVQFGNAGGQTASCTVNVSVQPAGLGYTPIYLIQGSASTSPLAGQSVTTRGVVTRINNNGYYIQDAAGDGNASTSDGLFIFTSSAPSGVALGNLVQITGTVQEYNTGAAGNALTAAHPVTELTGLSGLQVLATGQTISPTVITFPEATEDDLEKVEGMLVTINTQLTASQNYFQGRYGQVTLGAGSRLYKPTNLHRPGTAGYTTLVADNARRRILLDDGSSLQNPNPTPFIGADNTLRAGDTLSSITGVIDYGLATSSTTGLADYKIHPTVTPAFTRANARSTAPGSVGGNVNVASFNVLNYFTTFTDGSTAFGGSGQGCTLGGATSAANCRGADNLAEFNRQQTKIVKALAAMNADVVGLMEIQNNGNTAVNQLVSALNAEIGASTYTSIALPAAGTGTDAIRVAMIYKAAVVTPSGAPQSDTAAINNRPTLAQAFTLNANGEKFSVVVNHFKSKSCSGAAGANADSGDGQGCYNNQRLLQAQQLRTFITTLQTQAADSDVIVIGDLNAYAKEDPIHDLTSNGLHDLLEQFGGATEYSYVFDGEAGYLDHALASASLQPRVVNAVHWHINADEPSVIDYNTEFKVGAGCTTTCSPDYYSASPYRASDHDPVLIGLDLSPPAAQSINFPTVPDQTLNLASFTLNASASSGLSVAYTSQTAAVCTVDGNGTVSLLVAGTCTITAAQAGNSYYLPAASVQRSFNVAQATQSISFAAPAPAPAGGTVNLAATATSGLPVSFASSTPAVCTVSGSTATLIAAGNCTITATQAGNASYAAATPVAQSFNVTTATGGSEDGDVPIAPGWLLLQALGLGGLGWRQIRRSRRVQ